MAYDPNKVTEARKAGRERTSGPEWRQIVALEQIADTLEAMRIDFAALGQVLGVAQTRGKAQVSGCLTRKGAAFVSFDIVQLCRCALDLSFSVA